LNIRLDVRFLLDFILDGFNLVGGIHHYGLFGTLGIIMHLVVELHGCVNKLESGTILETTLFKRSWSP
jgi:hypothetical protein